MAGNILWNMAVLPLSNFMAAAQQQQPMVNSAASTLRSLPIVGSLFSDAAADPLEIAHMDGRVQGRDLLSSHFGPYGWPKQSFDYVIVGGGTTGLAMANRLAEDGTNSVAVVEAGGFYEVDAGNATEVPMYLFNYFFDNGYMKNPLFDWYMYTEPQTVSVCQP